MRKLFTFLLLAATALGLRAAGLPKLSTDTQEYWYFLKFAQGVYVVASEGDGAMCRSAIPTGRSTQLWKVEGSSADGYTLTNKQGLRLYVDATSQGSGVYAAAQPTGEMRFLFSARGTNYAICPFSNSGQSLNCWGGMGLGNDVKLYDSNDANAPMTFVAEDEMSLTNAQVNVVPYPTSISMKGGVLDLHELCCIVCLDDSTELLAQRLRADLERTAGIRLSVSRDPQVACAGKCLQLTLNDNLGAEAYKLSITADGISVAASAYGGFFYALQTLRQLMPTAIYGAERQADAAWTVPLLGITDTPAMPHRGFHLDVSRHFFDKDEVKKLLDVASIYKLNRFHWHLTDDQGWRIEIPEYPRLTTVGAIRQRSMTTNDPSSGTQFFDDTEYGRGCYYTLDDLREVVAYARERNIEIMPEVDLPGHMVAALASYPELSCDPSKEYQVMSAGGISRDVLNVGKDEVIDFLKCVLGHVAEVFPFELIHIGGDECPTDAWRNNADCARRIQEEGLSSVNDLQPWLVEVLGTFLHEQYGKTVVVWDELLAHWNSKYKVKPVIMAWRSAGYASQAADKGFKSIVVPSVPLYLDQLQVSPSRLEIDSPYMGGYGDGTINSVDRIYNFNPRANVSGREHYVLGTQANLWTESCTSNREAEYQYYPRLLALSEIGWLPNAKKDFGSFYYRLQHHAAILKAKDICYAPHYFEPEELTPAQQAMAEAQNLLDQSMPGAVGYPDQSAFDALQQALNAMQQAQEAQQPSAEAALVALRAQIAAYKAAPIGLPQEGSLYKVVSASTFFRNRFAGSSLYVNGTALNIHYTQQTEPEELWRFVPQADGTYQLVSVSTGKAVTMTASEGGAVKAEKERGTNLAIRKATKPAGTYDYIPGVVNIKNGRYNLYAQLKSRTMTIVASADSALCYPGTWRIEAVDDYHDWLQKLLDKAEHILATADPHQYGQPTEAALQYLTDEVIAPIRQRLAQPQVSQQDYLDMVASYDTFWTKGTTSIADAISQEHYYLIRNAYFTGYYAAANASGKGIEPKNSAEGDACRWALVKNDNGTFGIRNKQTGSMAYVSSSAADQQLRLGREYQWTLREVTTDQGNTAIGITDRTGAFSWYTNPSAWNYVLLKPYDWGASVWQLVQTDEEVANGIGNVQSAAAKALLYDLTGRQLYKEPAHGVFIRGGQKVVKR